MKNSLKILDAYGLLPMQSFQIPSKTERGLVYTVEQMREGWRCECIGFQMNKKCRHIRIIQNQLNGIEYKEVEYSLKQPSKHGKTYRSITDPSAG